MTGVIRFGEILPFMFSVEWPLILTSINFLLPLDCTYMSHHFSPVGPSLYSSGGGFLLAQGKLFILQAVAVVTSVDITQ